MEIALSADILKALTENILDYQQEIDTKKSAEEADEKRVEKNVNSAEEPISTTLTSNEKTRYQKIGDEVFKVTIEKLDAIIQREKKAQRMALDIPKESSSFAKKLKKERGNITIEKKDESNNFWKKLMIVAGSLGGIYLLFKDKIDSFFSKAVSWLTDIGDFIRPIMSSLGSVFSGVLKVLTPVGSAILKGITDLFKPIGKYFDPDNPKNIFAGIGDFIYNAVKTVSGGLGTIFDSAVSGVKWLGEVLWDALKSVGSTIGGVVVDAFKTIGTILGEIGTFLKDKVVSAVSSLFGGDAGAVQQALGTAKTEASSATNVVQSALNQDIMKRGNLDAMVSDAESFKKARLEALNKQFGSVENLKKQLQSNDYGISVNGDEKSGFTVNIDDKGKQHFIEVAAFNFGKSLFKRVAGITSGNHGTPEEQAKIANVLGDQLKQVANQFIKITNDNNIEIDTGHNAVKQAILNTHKWLSENTSWYSDTNDIADNLKEAIEGTNKDALNEIMKAAQDGTHHFQSLVRDKIDALNAHAQADKQDKTNRWKLIESQGLGPFVRHEEAMKTIKEVTDTLNKSLDTLHKTIGESFVDLVNNRLLSDVKVDVEPIDGREVQLQINQVDVESLNKTINTLTTLEEANKLILDKQNAVLDDILKELQTGAASDTTVNNIAIVNGNTQSESSKQQSPNAARPVPRPAA